MWHSQSVQQMICSGEGSVTPQPLPWLGTPDLHHALLSPSPYRSCWPLARTAAAWRRGTSGPEQGREHDDDDVSSPQRCSRAALLLPGMCAASLRLLRRSKQV